MILKFTYPVPTTQYPVARIWQCLWFPPFGPMTDVAKKCKDTSNSLATRQKAPSINTTGFSCYSCLLCDRVLPCTVCCVQTVVRECVMIDDTRRSAKKKNSKYHTIFTFSLRFFFWFSLVCPSTTLLHYVT